MSLKAFHVFFISLSTLLCVGIAAWRGSIFFEEGGLGNLTEALGAAMAAVGLLVYGRYFLRKYKDLSYL